MEEIYSEEGIHKVCTPGGVEGVGVRIRRERVSARIAYVHIGAWCGGSRIDFSFVTMRH